LALKIERTAGSDELIVRLLHSPFGSSPPAPFRPPFAQQEAGEVLRALSATISRGGGPVGSARHVKAQVELAGARPCDPQEIGRLLFQSLFVGSIRENLLSSLGLLSSRDHIGLRIRLVIDPAVADLVGSLPWELLYRAETRDFLGRNLRTPIVRQLEVSRPSLTPTPIANLRVLVVLSDPEGVTRLDVDRERELIRTAVGSTPGLDLRVLEKATVAKLRKAVLDEPFDALHFVGHGDLDASGFGTVLFEDEAGGAHPVPAMLLADTLKGFTQVRLVFLNACETARLPRNAAGHDPFLGTASALVMAGIPAVVAMQFPVTDRAALSFSSAFYARLAAGDPLETAVAEGRWAILEAEPQSWEWATPILFLGVPDGRLFARTDQDAPAAAALPAAGASAPLERALDLLETRHYEQAVEALVRAREVDADDPKSAYYLAIARLQGRRPRAARLDVIKKAESDLETAGFLVRGEEPAQFWFLQALIKHDFYRFKGLKVQPPAIEDLLVEAGAAASDPSELQRLLDHVPTPPSPVRDAIEARLSESGGR
jgi:CHAT domain